MFTKTIAIGPTFEELVVGYRVRGLGGVIPRHALHVFEEEWLNAG